MQNGTCACALERQALPGPGRVGHADNRQRVGTHLEAAWLPAEDTAPPGHGETPDESFGALSAQAVSARKNQ